MSSPNYFLYNFIWPNHSLCDIILYVPKILDALYLMRARKTALNSPFAWLQDTLFKMSANTQTFYNSCCVLSLKLQVPLLLLCSSLYHFELNIFFGFSNQYQCFVTAITLRRGCQVQSNHAALCLLPSCLHYLPCIPFLLISSMLFLVVHLVFVELYCLNSWPQPSSGCWNEETPEEWEQCVGTANIPLNPQVFSDSLLPWMPVVIESWVV